MRDFRYTIGVDTDTAEQAIAEAAQRLTLGSHLLYEYHDYDGEMPVNGEVKDAEAIPSDAGPDFAVQLTVEGQRALPHHVVPGFEMVERV